MHIFYNARTVPKLMATTNNPSHWIILVSPPMMTWDVLGMPHFLETQMYNNNMCIICVYNIYIYIKPYYS